VLIGFESDEDWFDYRLEHHPEFLRRVSDARIAIREGRGTRLEDVIIAQGRSNIALELSALARA
jgi:hypothetical protein